MRLIGLATTAVLLAGTAGCATLGEAPCAAGFDRATTVELLFGRNIGSQLGVSEADWRRFVAEEIAPRFPAGFTVLDGAGQWRGDDGTIVSEPSKLVVIVAVAPEARPQVEAVRAAYKERFAQEAVLAIAREECVGF
jgi:hypothetical protein